jgi:hypothetical protein
MYNVFEYLKAFRSFKLINTEQNEHIQVLQCNYPIPAKNEPYETDKPVPQKYIYY